MPPSWMLTAFEPFDGRKRNCSAMIMACVHDERIERRLLPVVFDTLAGEISGILASKPSILILMGETSERRGVRVERVALNVLDAGKRPDNRAQLPVERPVLADDELARLTTWDADLVVNTLCERGIEARKSYHAGTYACNQALFLALASAAERGLDIPIGFLHVPGRARFLQRTARDIARALPDVFSALAHEVAT